jgi:putative transposase
VSQVLPLFKRKSTAIEAFVPELYLHGLAQGDFDLALRGLLGGHASLSSSTVARLKEKGHTELARWQTRPLNDLEVVYLGGRNLRESRLRAGQGRAAGRPGRIE